MKRFRFCRAVVVAVAVDADQTTRFLVLPIRIRLVQLFFCFIL